MTAGFYVVLDIFSTVFFFRSRTEARFSLGSLDCRPFRADMFEIRDTFPGLDLYCPAPAQHLTGVYLIYLIYLISDPSDPCDPSDLCFRLVV